MFAVEVDVGCGDQKKCGGIVLWYIFVVKTGRVVWYIFVVKTGGVVWYIFVVKIGWNDSTFME